MNHCQVIKSCPNLNENNNAKEYDNNQGIQNNDICISQQSLNYTDGQRLPQLYIKCSPKLVDHWNCKEIMKGLFARAHIEKDFEKFSKHLTKQIGFEY